MHITHPGTRGRLSVVLAVLTALALALVAGCGSGDDQQTAAGATPSGAADFIPASAPVYVELSTDVDGPQWTSVFSLADRFPALEGLRQKLAQAGGDGITFEQDIKPLLGGRAGIALLDLPSVDLPDMLPGSTTGPDALEPPDVEAGSPRILAVAELADGKAETARALLARELGAPVGTHAGADIYRFDEDGYLAIVDDAVVVASTRDDLTAAIDAHNAGGQSVISGVDRYTDTIAKLPAGTVLQAYVDIGRVGTALLDAVPQLGQSASGLIPTEGTLGVSLAAEAQGLRLKGVLTDVPAANDAAEFTPSLTAHVPGDAIAYIGLSDVASQVSAVLDQVVAGAGANEQLQQLIQQLPALLGVSADDLSALFGGEHALVVTRGTRYPGIALVLQQEDGARATRTLDALRVSVPTLLSRLVGAGDIPEWKPAALANGVSGWQLPLSEHYGVVYGVDGNLAIIGSSVDAVRQVQQPVPPLSENAAFVAATGAMPEQVTGVLWVDVAGAIQLADTLGAFEGKDELLDNLRPLKSIAGWTTVDGDVSTFEALLTIG
jgi:hypothetical protein